MSDVRICKNGHEMPEDNIFWRKNTNGKIYGSCLKRYGITLKEYDNLLEQQGGKCAICELENPFNRDFHIDHCHITKKVRGILCATCNTALGHAKDSPELLRKMADYIEQHR